MKKSIFAAVLFVAGFAVAETVDTEYVIGVIPVSLAATQRDIILNIPWIEAGSSDTGVDRQGVAVANLVKTANLTAGDILLWYDGSQYQGWSIVDNAWVPTTIAASDGVAEAISATQDNLLRGQAIALHRNTLPAEARTIYVVGQVGSSGTGTTTIAASGYTLIAPPSDSDTDLNSSTDVEWSDATSMAHDVIYVNSGSGNLVAYTYKSSTWGMTTYDKSNRQWVHENSLTIPKGQGFYYYRGTNTLLTVTWKKIPTTVVE